MSTHVLSTHSHLSSIRRLRVIAVGAAMLVASVAWAQSGAAGARSSIEATYQRDRAACMASDSQHERTSCLREAGAVRAEALRGVGRGGESQETLMRNALERCKRQPADQQAICERMVRGEGSATGSVESGGMIRELTIMEPARPGTPSPAQPPMASPPPAPGAAPLAPLPTR
ncbi:hypothetical protein J2W49_000035 [Hydrogenophaga palleronii]|uniref:Uncharacterized protein n=1 Tax=Hydrogenophaga palleronii TaxID=65655 RepID=A0ABU1WFR3_9BURK|nr:hypothetical protein [Hydrogenophaga palleronii]MDR7148107.1 hypothetical protein [Hydrogenophaga palleronii]